MHVIITSPDISEKNNVSGVASVVRQLLKGKNVSYSIIKLGRRDNGSWISSLYSVSVSFLKVCISRGALIHVNMALNPRSIIRDTAIIVASKLFRKKVLLHIHGGRYLDRPSNEFYKFFIKLAFSLSDTVVALSSLEVKKINTLYYHNEKIKYIYNAVDFDTSKIIIKNNSRPKILFAGRLVSEKGVELFIDLAKQYSEFCDFYVAGRGSLEDDVKNAHSAGVLNFIGALSQDQIREFLISVDIVVLPSRAEGLPMIIVEAMAAGAIPVVSDVGSLSEVVVHGSNGMIIKDYNLESYTLAVKSLLDLSNMETMSMMAFQTAVEKFSIDDFHEAFLSSYREII